MTASSPVGGTPLTTDVAAPSPSRRDFLTLVTGACAGIGSAAVAWAFLDSMNPAAGVVAAGAPIDVDLRRL